MMNKLIISALFLPVFSMAQAQTFAQDQEMYIYRTDEYASRPVSYTAFLEETEVEEILAIMETVTNDIIKAIRKSRSPFEQGKLRIMTCSGYITFLGRKTCNSGDFYTFQQNIFDEWVLAPEAPQAWSQ